MIGGGGLMCPPLFIFLLKISPLDQTLRPTCKFLILNKFNNEKKKKNSENLVYKKFYYINSQNFLNVGGGAQSAPLYLFVKTIEKVISLCTVLKKKYLIFHVILEIDR